MNNLLPLEIRKIALKMFAYAAHPMFGYKRGFSRDELYEWFKPYLPNLQEWAYTGTVDARPKMLEDLLALLPVEQQCDLLLKMIAYRGPMHYGEPDEDEKENLKSLILDFQATVRGTTSTIATVSWKAVRENWIKAMERVSGDPEGAITSARAALESVCKHILDEAGTSYNDDGDLAKLYKATARQLQISPDSVTEQTLKQMMTGCIGIVSGLSGLRNSLGDAHGKSPSSPTTEIRHARLAINATMTVAEFLIETYEAGKR